MPSYAAPLNHINFVLDEVLGYSQHCQANGSTMLDTTTKGAILEGIASFAEEQLYPLNASGDTQGCSWSDGAVQTPKGYQQAYQQFMTDGWPGLSAPVAQGGQGLPESLGVVITEILGSANPAWYMYTGLTKGATLALEAHGSTELKEHYLPRMYSGQWSGTMCLTEPHCGSDLGLLKTRASLRPDGRYAISGTKIFISAGEHDLTSNIVHLVLARADAAPSGTQGLTLFLVPKWLTDEQGQLRERNAVHCSSIEHKMGMNGSSTCVMNFDGAQGYLVGELNQGLRCMFTMMNHARLTTAMQGLCMGEMAYQTAAAYAKDRLQMRSLKGPQFPELPADPILVHPDVRRMLLTMKAFNLGNRALAYYTALQMDVAESNPDPSKQKAASEQLAILTPICKAFMTETGLEVTSLGVQVLGGHGYIREWGQEQLMRDCRIASIYEGTTGIQALDLLGRKVLASQGSLLSELKQMLQIQITETQQIPALATHASRQARLVEAWQTIAQIVALRARDNADEIGAASVDYLMLSGYILHGHFWLKMMRSALAEPTDAPLQQSILHTGEFFFQRLLLRADMHLATLQADATALMSPMTEHF